MENAWSASQRVRLKSDPGKNGVLTGDVQERRGKNKYLVIFPDGDSWVNETALEIVDSAARNVVELLKNKQFGRVTDLRRNLTNIQLSGRLANIVYSMDTTNTEFYAYQYKPVLSFLEAPSKGILIADEVGLGKTIEAGLIWTELRSRFDARRLMVVCPAVLKEKWKDELANRFGIEATLMGASELFEELNNRTRSYYPPGRAIICSYDGLRPPKSLADDDGVKNNSPRAKLAELLELNSGEEPLFDLVVFDEAHKMRNSESATSKLGRIIREVSEHLVLLSATPVNLHSQDLYQLLNIVDEDTFSNEHVFPSVLKANQPLVKAQNKALDKTSTWDDIAELIESAQTHSLLKDNQQLKNILSRPFSAKELKENANRVQLANRIERCNLLSKVLTRTRKVEVKELRIPREPYAPIIIMTEVEAALYERVTNIVRRYALTKDISDGFLLASPQRQLSSSMYAAVKSWTDREADDELQSYEDFGNEKSNIKKAGPLTQTIMNGVLGTVDLNELWKNDSKFKALQTVLVEYLDDNPEEKIILFSYFRPTLKYLSNRLSSLGYKNQILMGGMRESKQSIINRFRDNKDIKILLASEVASEGVDLQFCRVLINYDLPWNPMKIEQRIGRIDRHGQKAKKLSILNFCYHDTIDQRIYERLYKRLNIFKESLGDLEAILGEKISELTSSLLKDRRTPEQENALIEQTSLALEKRKISEQELELQASNLIAHSGHILQEVNAAHQFSKRITETDLSIFVKDFLERHCQGFIFFQSNPEDELYEIQLPANEAALFRTFIDKRKLYGISSLDNGQKKSCRFFNKVTTIKSVVEFINQTHPLIQFISKRLKDIDEAFIPLVSCALPNAYAPNLNKGIYVASIQRASYEGLRVEEKLIARVKKIDEESVLDGGMSLDIINLTRLNSFDWPEAKIEINEVAVKEDLNLCDDLIEDEFEYETQLKTAENIDRVNLQITSAQKHFERQVASSESALWKHRLAGRTSLTKATEGRINKIQERFTQRKAELELHQKFKPDLIPVCQIVFKIVE
ncbi:SNF2-related protein [Colwellia hornerae]|uniref:Helicase n=1 Tax=Colwellia hornerae TaxID=89402 RepID=A0A5C6Q2Y1_9GAMM|nr:SNF2-related protein [Colwellia hornerae]TWX46359.1 helicase [Colwellia hornerae]TWX53924.1 helicase [Colwellia hornerae]TWX63047.1 helicase [Colwellia hornerae]